MTLRVTYLATAPLPYDTPILNELARLVDLDVIYLRRSHALSNFSDNFGAAPEFRWSSHWSASLKVPWADFWAQLTVGVALPLERAKPDVILAKSWNPFILEAIVWKVVRRRRFVMWSESTRSSGLMRGATSQALRRAVLSRMDRVVTIGSQATEFLTEDLHVDERKIRQSCLPSGLADEAVRGRAWVRADDYDAEAPRFLFVGRLMPRKQASRLVDVFRSVRDDYPRARLTIVGEGPLRPALERSVAGETNISFNGWLEGRELSALMRQHDVLVIPSDREVWGLVVNEALAHGLYVIATHDVGSAHDLLDAEHLGCRVDAHEAGALKEAMIAAARQGHANGERARRARRVESCSARAFAEALAQAAQDAAAPKDFNANR
jgi:glycosyltransferase involved in cell wall biosynthesis